jgi:hypothetical protein
MSKSWASGTSWVCLKIVCASWLPEQCLKSISSYDVSCCTQKMRCIVHHPAIIDKACLDVVMGNSKSSSAWNCFFQSCSCSSLRVKKCKILLCGWQCLMYLGDITTLCSCKHMFNFDDAVHTWSPVAEFFNVGLFSWFCMCGYYRIELIAMRIVFVHCFHCTSILHASCSLVDLVAMYVLKN